MTYAGTLSGKIVGVDEYGRPVQAAAGIGSSGPGYARDDGVLGAPLPVAPTPQRILRSKALAAAHLRRRADIGGGRRRPSRGRRRADIGRGRRRPTSGLGAVSTATLIGWGGALGLLVFIVWPRKPRAYAANRRKR